MESLTVLGAKCLCFVTNNNMEIYVLQTEKLTRMSQRPRSAETGECNYKWSTAEGAIGANHTL